jgi:hypothetical protein
VNDSLSVISGRGWNSGLGLTSKKRMISRHGSHRNERVASAAIGLPQLGHAGHMLWNQGAMAALAVAQQHFKREGNLKRVLDKAR